MRNSDGTVVLKLPTGMTLPNANQRLHYMTLYRQKKLITDMVYTMVKLGKYSPMLSADVLAIIHPDVRTRTFDPHNWGDAVKAAIDGTVRAGLLPNDSTRYLRAVTFIGGTPVRGWQLELHVTPFVPGDGSRWGKIMGATTVK